MFNTAELTTNIIQNVYGAACFQREAANSENVFQMEKKNGAEEKQEAALPSCVLDCPLAVAAVTAGDI